MAHDLDTSALNRAGRRAAEKRAKRMRTAGAVLAAGAATFGTTATLVGVTASTAGAAELTVLNLNADGAGSLHDVAEGAGDGDVIVFQAGLTGTITLNDDIDIDTSVTVQGPGAGVVTVSGNNAVRVFNIDGPGSDHIDVVISGLTITNGATNFGAGIWATDASLTVRDSVITANTSTSGGGGIAGEDEDMALVIENSQLTGNIADGDGGGLYWYSNGGSVTITNSTISGNSADENGGGAWIDLFESSAGATITNTTVSGNTADSDGGGLSLYFSGFSITGSTITGNTSSSDGGGINAYYIPAAASITNTTITGNTAEQGGGMMMRYANGDSVNIIGSVISGNHATDGYGGGLYFGQTHTRVTVAFTTIEGNDATSAGGGIEWYQSDVLRILNSTLSGNFTGDVGGGLYVSSNNYDVVEIFNTTISGNTATNEGGGIFFASYYGLEIAQSTITGNTGATIGGLAIYCGEESGSLDSKGHEADTPDADKTEFGGGKAHDRPDPVKPTKGEKVRAAAFGDVNLSGTIIAGNSGTDIGDCGTVTSDHSLLGTIAGATLVDVGGTILGKLPLVAPLANNGGPTQTHALLPDSPAINTGPVPVATFEGNNSDQRGEGFPRVVAGVVDIGAYEVQPPVVNFTG